MRASLLAIAVMLVGCRTWDINHTVDISSSGQKLCAKHHIPLVCIRAYGPPQYRDRIILVDDDSLLYHGEALSDVANPIGMGVSLHPTGILRRPLIISYCVRCEKEFRDALRVPDERAAIRYVQRGLPTGAPIAAAGPYDTSLHDGVWTVRSSTADGRRLTVKIDKEAGRLLAWDVAK